MGGDQPNNLYVYVHNPWTIDNKVVKGHGGRGLEGINGGREGKYVILSIRSFCVFFNHPSDSPF